MHSVHGTFGVSREAIVRASAGSGAPPHSELKLVVARPALRRSLSPLLRRVPGECLGDKSVISGSPGATDRP